MNFEKVIAERSTKTVYQNNGRTIKLFVENYSKSDILNEAVNQARVEETGLNIAKLLEVTKFDNRWALVSEYIEGKTLEELMNENPEKIDEYLNIFIDTQLKIMDKNAPLLGRLKDKMKRKINMTDIDDNSKYELLQRIETSTVQNKLCHGDFNPSNIIIKEDGTIYVIDWSHVTQGNALADVAMSYLIFKKDGKEEIAEKYLDLFCEKTGAVKQNIQRWIPPVAAAHLDKAKGEEKEFLNKCIDIIDYE